ncbi:LSU ribosomal protein L10p (P0) [Lachnospiraceae bacterium TWA4]|nr:LSU ribosomal protein L10p (P0) [Lachnospiraceae bacterium TWA4]
MAKVELKQPIVAEISELLKDAKSVVLADYRGLTVEQDTALRKQLRENGVVYKVYKNTMIKFAIKGTPFEELAKDLEGPTAMAVSCTDETAPAKHLANFAKKADQLQLKGGVVDGAYYDEKGIQVIASVPSRDELLGRLLGSMQSPVANFARVINQIAEKEEA